MTDKEIVKAPELKACPFCGEKEDIDYGIMTGTMQGFDYVQCQSCGAEIHAIHKGKYIDAIKAWNGRADNIVPPADVAPVVHGRWIDVGSDELFACSECGTEICAACNYEGENMFSRCPYCGAKMDVKKLKLRRSDEDDKSTMERRI